MTKQDVERGGGVLGQFPIIRGDTGRYRVSNAFALLPGSPLTDEDPGNIKCRHLPAPAGLGGHPEMKCGRMLLKYLACIGTADGDSGC